mmetsp:Transcript_19258/g.39028  ORF Transcript_19258/g.39028 Transcript_19258/m.39028 type:complete len:267 (-) Transcript_19258:38-838(-)
MEVKTSLVVEFVRMNHDKITFTMEGGVRLIPALKMRISTPTALFVAIDEWIRGGGGGGGDNMVDLEMDQTTPLDNEDFGSADNQEVISNDESLSAPTSSPQLLVCTEVSYQLNNLSTTAQELLHEEGNTTLKEGLEIAVSLVAQEFVESVYTTTTTTTTPTPTTTTTTATATADENRRRRLRVFTVQHLQRHLSVSLAYTNVTTVVDLPAFLCTKPNCLVVTQHVCLRVNEDESDAMEYGLRQALREAVMSGRLIQKVPSPYLPSP